MNLYIGLPLNLLMTLLLSVGKPRIGGLGFVSSLKFTVTPQYLVFELSNIKFEYT